MAGGLPEDHRIQHRLSRLLSSGHADLGLTFSDEASVDLRFQHLIDEELVVVSPPAAKSRSVKKPAADLHALPAISLRALSELPLVLPGNPHSLRRLLDQYQQRERVEFRVIAEANAIPQLIELAQAGVAHTILSYEAVRQEAQRGEVVLRRIGASRLTGRYSVPLGRPAAIDGGGSRSRPPGPHHRGRRRGAG